jgi:hypothetical protein
MPAISLVVCVYKERDLLERLLREMPGNYHDLVVVHDGPEDTDEEGSIEELVTKYGGRFFSEPRCFQQEPHWPFAWQQAKHDWILRLDADEFPSTEMKEWLRRFRQAREPEEDISGYTCIWPLWNGQRTISRKYAPGRIFLFNRQRVRFFGMAEQVPIADGRYEPVDLILHHQPTRKSYGLCNILLRRQAYRWRTLIAQALLGKPGDLNCWRWNKDTYWPPTWEQIRSHPFLTAFRRLFKSTLNTLRDQWKIEGKVFPLAALSNPLHHALLSLRFWSLRRQQRSTETPPR